MVVCKFFQQGNCRYGQSCRFEHIYGSKYSYHAAPVSQPAQSGVTDEQLVNQVESDVKAVLNGGQWILSCYSPFKKSNFPGISDLSPEEARLFIYEAKANNSLEQAVSFMNNQFMETRQKYEQLARPSLEIIQVLKSLYRGETAASPFTRGQNSGFQGNSAATSIFRSAVQGTSVFAQNTKNSSSSVFGQTNQSIFGQNTANTNQSIFGQSQPDTKPSVFAQNTNSVFGQNSVFDQKPSNVFGSPTDSAKSIFAQASQNVFGPSSPSNVFGPANPDPAKSIFAQASQSLFNTNQAQPANSAASVFNTASQSAFGMANDPFNQQQTSPFMRPEQNFFQVQTDESSVYSDINELSPEEVEAFKADDFRLGFIPEIPPPRSLCF